MAVATEVDITGLQDAFDNLEELPSKVQRRIVDKINEAAIEARNVAIKRLTQRLSGNQEGLLRASIGIRQQATLSTPVAIIAAGGEETTEGGFDYALPVEFGTRPHFPPVKAVTGTMESLDLWVKRMNPTPRNEEQDNMSQSDLNESVAFNIAKKISRVGTREKPFMRPAFNIGAAMLKKEMRTIGRELNL